MFLFYACMFFFRIFFSFILLLPRLKIPATYEAQQVPPEWSPKFLPADLLFCVTLRIHSACLCGIHKHHVCERDSNLLNAHWQELITQKSYSYFWSMIDELVPGKKNMKPVPMSCCWRMHPLYMLMVLF